MGIESGGYDFKVTEKETQVVLTLPLEFLYSDQHALIYKKVADEIDKLPPFPDYITEIQKAIQDPAANIKQISRSVLRDRNLTANIISLANSSIYGLSGTISEVDEAIKIIGIEALENLMYSAGVEHVFVKEKKAKNIFHVNHEIAELALELARELRVKRSLWESLYIGTYLHNIGLFSFEHLNPGIQEDVQQFCQDNRIPVAVMEDVFTGYNYSEVGTFLAEKWNFPPVLQDIIRYHTYPAVYKGDFKDLVYIAHLALFMYHCKDQKPVLLQISFAVRREFKIKSLEDLEALLNKFKIPFTI